MSEKAEDRLRKRLAQNRMPSTQAATESWVNWNGMGDYLGQPFSVTKIPISKLEQMRRDPMISFGLMFAKIPLITAPWYIKSSDPQRAAFIDNALRKIYGRLILAYTNSFDFGYSAIVKRFEYAENLDWTYIDKSGAEPVEKPVWTDDTVKPLIWKPFLALPPKQVAPHWNANEEFAGIDYVPSASGSLNSTGAMFPFEQKGKGRPADIPLDWALWATNEKDSVFGSLYGYPRIGYSYRFWWSYWYKFGLADRAFEKWADPPVIVRHPTDDGLTTSGDAVDYTTEALNLAEKIRSGANVSIPSDAVTGLDDRVLNMREWEIEQLETQVDFDAFNKIFEYLDVMKLRSVMVPEQSLVEGKGGSSSRNVAQVFGDLFHESQAVVMQEIDDHINRFMIPQLLEANFGPGGPPCEKVTTGFDPQDIDTMRTVIGAIANKSGAETLPIDIREMLGRLGLPLLSQKDHQKVLDKRAEELAKMQPPPVPAQKGQAGVTKAGLYYGVDNDLNFSEEEKSTIKKFFDRILFRD